VPFPLRPLLSGTLRARSGDATRGPTRRRPPRLLLAFLVFLSAPVLVASGPVPAAAQSAMSRTPNLSGAWVGEPRTVYFDYLHRFDLGAATPGAVEHTPTFTLGLGLGGYALVGTRFTPETDLHPSHGGEWEFLARLSPLSTAVGALFDFGLTAAYNERAGSLDGEIGFGIPVGRLKLLGVVRGFSDGCGAEEARGAYGGGVILPLTEALAVSADVVRPFDLEPDEATGWGAAIQLDVPGTPHVVSLQAGNTNSSTLQGSSRRATGTRWGVQVTVPLTPGRWFGSEGAAPGGRLGEADLVSSDTVEIRILDTGFAPARVTVRPGTFVRWVHDAAGIHQSVSTTGAWRSPLLAPGDRYGRVFTEAGEFPYCSRSAEVCGVIVVREGGG